MIEALRPPRAWALTVGTELRDGVAVLTLTGRVSRRTSPILRQALEAATVAAPVLVLDFGAVDYISSAGIEILADVATAAPAGLLLCGLADPLRIPLDLAGLPASIRVEPTVARALASIAGDGPAERVADPQGSDR